MSHHHDLISEEDFRKYVIEFAQLHGWRYLYIPDSRHNQGQPGYPDLTLAREGRIIFAELKAQKGTVRNQQKEWLKALGGSYAFRDMNEQIRSLLVTVWRPVDIDEIERVLVEGW